MAYKLKLPQRARIYPIFHVSLLKQKISDNVLVGTELPPMVDDGDIVVEPETILDTR